MRLMNGRCCLLSSPFVFHNQSRVDTLLQFPCQHGMQATLLLTECIGLHHQPCINMATYATAGCVRRTSSIPFATSSLTLYFLPYITSINVVLIISASLLSPSKSCFTTCFCHQSCLQGWSNGSHDFQVFVGHILSSLPDKTRMSSLKWGEFDMGSLPTHIRSVWWWRTWRNNLFFDIHASVKLKGAWLHIWIC